MTRAAARLALLLLATSAPAAPALADQVKPPDLSSPDAWLPRKAGTFRILNKIDSTAQQLAIEVGGQAPLRTLTIRLEGCYVRPDDLPPDAAAHLVITDSTAAATVFDGWMLQREPALGMLEHPVYDVQLAGCQ